MEILNLVKFIADNLNVFALYIKNDIPHILILLSKICRRPHLQTIMKSLDLQDLFYRLIWNTEELRGQYDPVVMQSFEEIKADSQKLYFSNQNIYFQNFMIKTLENLAEYPSPVLNDEFKEVVNKIFQISNKIQGHLLMDSQTLLLERVLERLLYKVYQVYLANPQAIEDFKELFVFCGKQTLNLIFNNKIDPVKLIHHFFSFLTEVSKCNNKMVLDCVTLNLNDTISLAANLDEENPWIKEIWEEIIVYLTSLFQMFYPRELTNNEIWVESSQKSQPITFSSLESSIFENKEFVAFKCKFILNLLKLIQIIVKKTELLQESQQQIVLLLDEFIKQSEEFNCNQVNRYVLWKKGYFSMKNSLPSLHIFEKNVLIVQLYNSVRKFHKGSNKIFEFVCKVLESFKQRIEELDKFIEFVHSNKQVFTEPEFDSEFKAKTVEEQQKNIFNFYNVIVDIIEPFLLGLDYETLPYNKYLDHLIQSIIDFLPHIKIKDFHKMHSKVEDHEHKDI